MEDGDAHQRLRALGSRGLAPTTLNHALPMIQHVVDGLLDRVAGRGQLDVVADLARPLPSAVIAELFGIPAVDRKAFQAWSADAGRFFGAPVGDPAEAARKANTAAVELERYFRHLLHERRRAPGTDLVSLLLAGQADGQLSDEDVCCQCILLLAAGHITTVDQLSNAVFALLTHADQLELLRADPDLAAAAVEEALRYDAAVPFLHRVAREDLEFGGRAVRAGQLVYLGLAAANRDPEAFADPDRFDLLRANNRHVAFGAGPHLCLGASLARRQLVAALRALPQRLPGLRLDPQRPPRRRCDSLVFRGFATLPVVFS